MNFSLKGKAALITGAAQGIGVASAITLAEAGAKVILADVEVMSETLDYIKN